MGFLGLCFALTGIMDLGSELFLGLCFALTEIMDLGSELFGSLFCLNRNQHQFNL